MAGMTEFYIACNARRITLSAESDGVESYDAENMKDGRINRWLDALAFAAGLFYLFLLFPPLVAVVIAAVLLIVAVVLVYRRRKRLPR
jgi:hypothetical protein